MKKLLLVLGAGASDDLGFPLGKGLLNGVIKGLDDGLQNPGGGDLVSKILATPDLWMPLGNDVDTKTKRSHLEMLKEALVNGQNENTIDRILGELGESKHHLEKIGRFAIAYFLMGCETKSLEEGKFFDRSFWLRDFWEKIMGEWESCHQRLRIVTFNYDRCVEHCLATTLWLRSVNADKEEYVGQNFMRNNIFHVYGSLGEYSPPLTKSLGNKSPFGSPNGEKEAINLQADVFSLMYDQRVKYPSEFFQSQFAWADRICFLGFGFDPDNMKKLGWSQVNTAGKEVIGTRFNEPDGEYLGINCKNLNCQDFWDLRCLPLD